MDERQAQIKEGAGLEEGRINQEFVDALQKWSTPVLLLLTAAAALWWGWQQLERMNYNNRDQAFAQLSDALAGSTLDPAVLEGIAADFASVPDAAILAKQSAGSAYVAAIIRGLTPDAIVNEDDSVEAQYILDQDARDRYARRARAMFTDVLGETGDDPARAVIAMNAAYGLAALAETEGNAESAAEWYDRAAGFAEAGGYDLQAAIARARAESAATLETVELPGDAQIARLPAPEGPAEGVDPLDRLGVTGADIEPGDEAGDEAGGNEDPTPLGPEVPEPASGDPSDGDGADDGDADSVTAPPPGDG